MKDKFPDAIIFVGGDFNKKNISRLTTTFSDLSPLQAGNTRGSEALDEIYSNVGEKVVDKKILRPLQKDDGTMSDHSIIAAAYIVSK